jgi:hypothetical protein
MKKITIFFVALCFLSGCAHVSDNDWPIVPLSPMSHFEVTASVFLGKIEKELNDQFGNWSKTEEGCAGWTYNCLISSKLVDICLGKKRKVCYLPYTAKASIVGGIKLRSPSSDTIVLHTGIRGKFYGIPMIQAPIKAVVKLGTAVGDSPVKRVQLIAPPMDPLAWMLVQPQLNKLSRKFESQIRDAVNTSVDKAWSSLTQKNHVIFEGRVTDTKHLLGVKPHNVYLKSVSVNGRKTLKVTAAIDAYVSVKEKTTAQVNSGNLGLVESIGTTNLTIQNSPTNYTRIDLPIELSLESLRREINNSILCDKEMVEGAKCFMSKDFEIKEGSGNFVNFRGFHLDYEYENKSPGNSKTGRLVVTGVIGAKPESGLLPDFDAALTYSFEPWIEPPSTVRLKDSEYRITTKNIAGKILNAVTLKDQQAAIRKACEVTFQDLISDNIKKLESQAMKDNVNLEFRDAGISDLQVKIIDGEPKLVMVIQASFSLSVSL